VRFEPRLPAEWRRLCFRIEVRGQVIGVDMTPGETTYRLTEGRGIMLHQFGEPVRLTPGMEVVRPARSDVHQRVAA
jgi:trehalose/maltose hydrolase-like predicted phosphorylase